MKSIVTFFSIFIICSSLEAQVPPPPQLQPGEKWTNLYSVSYDYQTNGSVRYLVQDPSNSSQLCAILMAQQDSNSAVGVQRYIYYSYTIDNGNTWTPTVLDASASWGFPDMSLSNGLPIIAAHRFNVISNVFKDIAFGGFAFELISGQPTNIVASWPHLTGTSNGNIVMVASTNVGPNFSGYYATYNGTSWIDWTALPLIGGPSGNYTAESGSNGIVGIFGTAYGGSGAIIYYRSTDNGITFDNGTEIFNYVIDGGDTLFASIVGGFQAVYVGSEPHLVFAVYNINANAVFFNANTLAYVKPKILHWSPSGGLRQVAGRFNIPNLADTITTALLAPVGQPSISRTASGKLICSFTTFIRGNTQVVENGDTLNAGEIFVNVSSDNGMTWSIPANITNTASVEEKHSSLLTNVNSDSLKIHYLRDMKAGGWVNVAAWGKAPVYGIYKSGPLPIGINEISSQAISYELSQNYPNPFNPSTVIKFAIPKSNFTSLIIYDALGKEVTRLVNQKLNTGTYEYEFSTSEFGLPSGVYFYKLISGEFVETKTMMLVK